MHGSSLEVELRTTQCAQEPTHYSLADFVANAHDGTEEAPILAQP
jgi:hypothetical protein